MKNLIILLCTLLLFTSCHKSRFKLLAADDYEYYYTDDTDKFKSEPNIMLIQGSRNTDCNCNYMYRLGRPVIVIEERYEKPINSSNNYWDIILITVISLAVLLTILLLISPFKKFTSETKTPNNMRKITTNIFLAILAWEILRYIPKLLDIIITHLK